MTLNVTFQLCCQCYAYAYVMHMLCYKVAVYLSYLHVNFDAEIEGNPFEFRA